MDRAAEFRQQGFIVERGFFSRDEVATVLAEVERCVAEDEARSGPAGGGLIFTTETFRRSQIVQRFLSQQRVIDFLKPIAGNDLWVRWDQAVSKRPGGAVFRWHQDNAYNKLRTEHFQLWVALTETRMHNGTLWLSPGSHAKGLLPHRHIDGQREVIGDVTDSVCIDASAGDLVLFSSLMLHHTGPNNADSTRVAYVAEYMPLADYDYAVGGPYFVVAENGKSKPHFINKQRGATPHNLKMYRRERMLSMARHPVRSMRTALMAMR